MNGPEPDPPKPWTWSEVVDIQPSEWILTIREYVPAGMRGDEGPKGYPVLDPACPPGCGRKHDHHRLDLIEIKGRPRRGRPTLKRWSALDDTYPVVAFAAYGLALKFCELKGSAEALARHIGCDWRVIAAARDRAGWAVPDIVTAFRAPVSDRAIKKYRAYHRLTITTDSDQERLLANAVRLFLMRCGPERLPADDCALRCADRMAHHATR
jgi:hypothetical protein